MIEEQVLWRMTRDKRFKEDKDREKTHGAMFEGGRDYRIRRLRDVKKLTHVVEIDEQSD